jgi:hypothetical protein
MNNTCRLKSKGFKIAFDQGEISLLNYLMEISFAYATIDKYLKAEHELNKTIALLCQYRE